MKYKKNIKDYLHFYPKVPIIIIENSVTSEGETIATSHYLEGIDWDFNKVIAERTMWDWDNIKPILRPLKDFNEEDFAVIAKTLLESENILIDIIDQNLWAAIRNEDMDEEEKDMTNSERIFYAESCDCDNVISISKNGEMDLSWGVSDEGRFSVGIKNQSVFFKMLLDMHFDVFNLIKDNIAVDKTTLPLKK